MNRAEQIILSPPEEAVINRWAHGKNIPVRLMQRAQIIQLSAHGVFSHDIAKRMNVSRPTVQLWRERFLALRLSGLEKDAPRPGRFPKISYKKVTAIVNATLHTTPSQATHWSTRSIAKAHGVSNATVQRIWKEHNLKPHLVETFKLSRDKRFLEKLYDIVGLYMNPPDKSIVLCVDEKSQIQALERTQPLLPLRPGIPARQTHDYLRHGTTTLFAALNYLDGSLISCTQKQHRHDEWLAFLKQINKETPKELDLHLIVDNYSTHKHQKVKEWLKKNPRFHMHFTPTGSSWMNLVERFFSDITNDVIRDGSFKNIKELEQSINNYLSDRNKNPKRYVWKKEGAKILEKINKARKSIGWNEYCEPN